MTAEEMNWAATSNTGRARYLLASSQPMGGTPSTSGHSQATPPPVMEMEHSVYDKHLGTRRVVLIGFARMAGQLSPLPGLKMASSRSEKFPRQSIVQLTEYCVASCMQPCKQAQLSQIKSR